LQKKPKALLWEVWTQLCQEAPADIKKALNDGAYDMVYVTLASRTIPAQGLTGRRKNVYTPHKIKTETGQDLGSGKVRTPSLLLLCSFTPPRLVLTTQREVIVALKEDGRDTDDDKRRFKVVFPHATEIDLDTIIAFCKGNKQTEQAKEMMVSFSNVLHPDTGH
jgi:eukaryotic translation initiation factor 2C